MRALGVVIGAILVLVGVIWILQGFNVLGGSAMSGRPTFSILGAVLVLVGFVLLARNTRRAGRAPGAGLRR
jgi:hypothetical protein